MKHKIGFGIVCVISLVLMVSHYVSAQGPTIIIYEPMDGAEVQSQTITLKATVTSPEEHPLEHIEVLVNGLPVLLQHKGMDPVLPGEIHIDIQLEEGENQVAIIAANDLGSAEQVITVTYTPSLVQRPNLYVLAIGVADYELDEYDLSYADGDAQDIVDAFATQEGPLFGEVKARPLLNEEASRGNILKGLEWILSEVTQRDLAVVFVSGHGLRHEVLGDYYFLPHDGDPASIIDTAILWFEFERRVKALPGKTMFFVDTCHAGGVTGAGTKSAALNLEAIQDFAIAGRGAMVMASSTGEEFSLEDPVWGHGAFTRAILEGLVGGGADYDGNGIIYTVELDTYVTTQVKELTGGAQHPTTETSTNYAAFPLFVLTWGGVEPTSTPVEATAKAVESTLPPTDTPTPTDTSVALAIGSTKTNPKDGAEMVYVPAGEFTMGSDDSDPYADDDEKPQHTVYLDAFWMYKTEVTNTQYRQCVEAGACTLPHLTTYYDDPAYADHPVVNVDWYQAKAYSEWAGGRLPTEAEWEKAARGLDGRLYPWGDAFDEKRCNTEESGIGRTTPVGRYSPQGDSPYGISDLAGNVWEWTGSLYGEYPYDPADVREDQEAEGLRVLRGGSWSYNGRDARCASRNARHVPDSFRSYLGFRVVALAAS